MSVRRRLRRLRRRAVPVLVAASAAALLLLALLAAVALTVPGLHGDVGSARRALTQARTAINGGDAAVARTQVRRADVAAQHARAATHGVIWSLAARVPVLGRPVTEARGLTDALAGTTSGVLEPLVAVDVRGSRWTGGIDTRPLVRAQSPLRAADQALTRTREQLDATPRSGLGLLSSARAQLTDELAHLAESVNEARVAAEAGPALAGADGPKTFFVAIQNNAEPRATGGLIGAYAVLRADHGRLTLLHVGPDTDLHDAVRPPLELGREYDHRYGRFEASSTWRSANLTPDVPTVGRTLAALWRQQTGQQVDGVLLLDPLALARLLGATGPVTLPDGTVVSSGNAAQLLMSDVYRRFPRSQDRARTAMLEQTAAAAITALKRPRLDTRRVLGALAGAAGSGHLAVWSADPKVQAVLERSRVAGALPATGPYLQVLTQDAGGSKLGWYLSRSVRYTSHQTGEAVDLGAGPELEEQATVDIQLRNDAPAQGLPDYVTLRADAGPHGPTGQALYWVSVYLGPRATLLRATLDGRPVLAESSPDRGHGVFSTYVRIDPQSSAHLVLEVRQPAAPGEVLTYRQQPLVRDDALTVRRDGGVRLLYPREGGS